MKKTILTMLVAVMAMANVHAQQISVVSPDGNTTLHRTLQAAIEAANAAEAGSVIYIPGGGFTIADSVKITNRMTIIGAGHKTVTDNVDGNTRISGNLFFNEGSSQSAIMGCYVTGNINVGNDGKAVDDVLVRYCNINSVQVGNSDCNETYVNQNYIRSTCGFGNSNAIVTNNIIHSLGGVLNGEITYNVVLNQYCYYSQYTYNGTETRYAAVKADLSKIMYNIIIPTDNNVRISYYYAINGSENSIVKNMMRNAYGEDYINPSDNDWNNIFENYNSGAIDPKSSFKLKGDYAEYNTTVGIYAGTGFNDKQLAPTPYIIEKTIDEQTDAQGKLKVMIKVKANQ